MTETRKLWFVVDDRTLLGDSPPEYVGGPFYLNSEAAEAAHQYLKTKSHAGIVYLVSAELHWSSEDRSIDNSWRVWTPRPVLFGTDIPDPEAK